MNKCHSLMKKKKNPVLTELASVDVYNMTPMQAMNLLLELKQIIEKTLRFVNLGFLYIVFETIVD